MAASCLPAATVADGFQKIKWHFPTAADIYRWMQDVADMELLRQYVRLNSDEAFAALVSRHVNMVYSAALRKTGNAHAAEEITQAVFIILAKKADHLRAGTILSGWLHQTARLTSSGFLRTEIRRARREQEAYMQSLTDESGADIWPEIEPLLDDAMGRLGEKDRNAIALRYFEGRNFQQIGVAFGTSENAAKKRVTRALEKLRKLFAKRGVRSTAETIAETISANSIQAAPVTLAKAVTAIAVAKGATASLSTLTLIKGALKIMASTKIKIAIVAGVGALLVTSVAPYFWYHHFAPNAWRYHFDAVYSLKDGENIRYIPPPYISERATYYRTEETNQAKYEPRGPDYFIFNQAGNDLRRNSMAFGDTQHSLREILDEPLGFWRYEFSDSDQLLNINLAGDWTIREGANREVLLAALEPVILKATGRRIHFEKRMVERDVIVAHGTAKTLDWTTKVQIFAEKSKVRGGGMGFGTLQQLLGLVGEQLDIYMVNEAQTSEPEQPGTASFDWAYYPDSNFSKMGNRRDELTDKVLKNVSEQTGLTFTREKRLVNVWFVTEQR